MLTYIALTLLSIAVGDVLTARKFLLSIPFQTLETKKVNFRSCSFQRSSRWGIKSISS